MLQMFSDLANWRVIDILGLSKDTKLGLGFTSAGIPVGITMSFLITTPSINEVAVLLLLSLLGCKFTLIYIVVDMLVDVLGGIFLDFIKAEYWLKSFASKALESGKQNTNTSKQTVINLLSIRGRHIFVKEKMLEILGVGCSKCVTTEDIIIKNAKKIGVAVNVIKESNPEALKYPIQLSHFNSYI